MTPRQAVLRGPVRGVVYEPATPDGWVAECLDCGQLWATTPRRPTPHARGCPGVPVRVVPVREVPR